MKTFTSASNFMMCCTIYAVVLSSSDERLTGVHMTLLLALDFRKSPEFINY